MGEYCRKHIIQIMILTCFILIFIGNNTSVARKNELDIEKLAYAVQVQRGTIIEWSLHTRELAEQPSQKWTVTKLKAIFSDWDWSSSYTEGNKTVTGIKHHGNIEEKIKVVTADNKDDIVSYASYEISGKMWDNNMSKKAEMLFRSRTETIFNKNQKPVVFSCIKGIFNEDDEFAQSQMNGLLSSLLATEKEALIEEDFISISAYSSLFSQSLSLHGEEMNLQIGLRKSNSGQGTYFTVGTPILTNEY